MTPSVPIEQQDAIPAEITFRLGSRIWRAPYYDGETILDTARRANIPLAAGCEQGNCGACLVTIISGSVTMKQNSVLSEAEVDEGLRLACQGRPDSGGLVIEIY